MLYYFLEKSQDGGEHGGENKFIQMTEIQDMMVFCGDP